MKCWWCGVKPDDVMEYLRLCAAEPSYICNWPPGGDHLHAEKPPTPGALEQAGHESLMRVRNEALHHRSPDRPPKGPAPTGFITTVEISDGPNAAAIYGVGLLCLALILVLALLSV